MSEQPEKLALTSMNIVDDRIESLKQIFPEAFSDGSIDFNALQRSLGKWIDPGKERFGLNWPGKAECIKTIQQPSIGTLLPLRDESVNFDTTKNIIIEGDNLEVLKLLQKSYYRKVKMIYIDPPYNTGNEFIYPDNFHEGLQDYLKYSGQVDTNGFKESTNTETDGRYHSNWLNMMYPRLFLAKNLLREDGVLFISIDDHEADNLTKICCEIFGEENIVGRIVVQLNPRGRHLDKFIAKTHEYILVVTKDITMNSLYPAVKDERMISEYKKEDIKGRYRELELRNRNPAFNKKTRPNLFYPIWIDPSTGIVSHEKSPIHSIEVYPFNSQGEESCWTWGKDKLSSNLKLVIARKTSDNEWRIFRKDYLNDDEGNTATTLPKSLWIDKDINNDVGKKAIQELFGYNLFDFPKSPDLIKKLIEIGSKDNDIILDFFAGSGTTAQAVLELNMSDNTNRKFILVQLPAKSNNLQYPSISSITRERVMRFIKKSNQQNSNFGFKAYKLSSSNFTVWQSNSGNIKNISMDLALSVEHIVKNRNNEDILNELLLKVGYQLTAAIEKLTLAGKVVYSISEGALLICLDRNLTLEVFESMVDLLPVIIICLDEGFKGNDQLKVNTVQTIKSHNQNTESNIVFRVV